MENIISSNGFGFDKDDEERLKEIERKISKFSSSSKSTSPSTKINKGKLSPTQSESKPYKRQKNNRKVKCVYDA